MVKHIKNMQETKENVIGVKITGREKKEIQNLINSGLFLSFSDFLRNALRDKLEEIKIIKIGLMFIKIYIYNKNY